MQSNYNSTYNHRHIKLQLNLNFKQFVLPTHVYMNCIHMSLYFRELCSSGLKVDNTCWPIWPTDPQNNPDVTYICPTCHPHIEVFFLKVMWHDMKNFDMEQCHRFLHCWQDTESVPCTEFLKMKSLDTTCFKTAWDNKLVSHQWYFSPFIRPKVYQMPRLFFEEYVISGSHPDNLVGRWDPLDPQKNDPSDTDCLGHPTHFQPWCSFLTICKLSILD